MGVKIFTHPVKRTASAMVDYVAGVNKVPEGKIIDSSIKDTETKEINVHHCMQYAKSHFEKLAIQNRKEELIHININVSAGETLSDEKFIEIGKDTLSFYCSKNSVFVHGRHYDSFHPHSHIISDGFLDLQRRLFMASQNGSIRENKKAWLLRRKTLMANAIAINKKIARKFEIKFGLPENTISLYFTNEFYVDPEFSIKETIRKAIDIAINNCQNTEDFLPSLRESFRDCYGEFINHLKIHSKDEILKMYGRTVCDITIYVNKNNEVIFNAEVFRCRDVKLGSKYTLPEIYERIMKNTTDSGFQSFENRFSSNPKDNHSTKDKEEPMFYLNLNIFQQIFEEFMRNIEDEIRKERFKNYLLKEGESDDEIDNKNDKGKKIGMQ